MQSVCASHMSSSGTRRLGLSVYVGRRLGLSFLSVSEWASALSDLARVSCNLMRFLDSEPDCAGVGTGVRS